MPQPPANTLVADRLIDIYRDAQTELLNELRAALTDPRQYRRANRLRELLGAVTAMRDRLDNASRTWLVNDLTAVHLSGAQAAATALGTSFQWTQLHVDGVQQLAARTWEDVAPSLRGMHRDSRRALRRLARSSAVRTVVEGQTAAQSADQFATWAAQQGISSVRYANGARHLIGDYADTVVRTTTAQAFNNGTLLQTRQNGTEWVEVIDGPDCGWTFHGDPDKANGTIRDVGDAMTQSLSHPRCARSFSPRPDITSQKQADEGARFDRGEQAIMAVQEQLRAETATATLSGKARVGRVARTSTRAPRAARVGR